MNGEIYVGRLKGMEKWDVELHVTYQNKQFETLPDCFKECIGMIAGGHDGIGSKMDPENYHPDRHQDVYKIKITPELLKQWFELGGDGSPEDI